MNKLIKSIKAFIVFSVVNTGDRSPINAGFLVENTSYSWAEECIFYSDMAGKGTAKEKKKRKQSFVEKLQNVGISAELIASFCSAIELLIHESSESDFIKALIEQCSFLVKDCAPAIKQQMRIALKDHVQMFHSGKSKATQLMSAIDRKFCTVGPLTVDLQETVMPRLTTPPSSSSTTASSASEVLGQESKRCIDLFLCDTTMSRDDIKKLINTLKTLPMNEENKNALLCRILNTIIKMIPSANSYEEIEQIMDTLAEFPKHFPMNTENGESLLYELLIGIRNNMPEVHKNEIEKMELFMIEKGTKLARYPIFSETLLKFITDIIRTKNIFPEIDLMLHSLLNGSDREQLIALFLNPFHLCISNATSIYCDIQDKLKRFTESQIHQLEEILAPFRSKDALLSISQMRDIVNAITDNQSVLITLKMNEDVQAKCAEFRAKIRGSEFCDLPEYIIYNLHYKVFKTPFEDFKANILQALDFADRGELSDDDLFELYDLLAKFESICEDEEILDEIKDKFIKINFNRLRELDSFISYSNVSQTLCFDYANLVSTIKWQMSDNKTSLNIEDSYIENFLRRAPDAQKRLEDERVRLKKAIIKALESIDMIGEGVEIKIEKDPTQEGVSDCFTYRRIASLIAAKVPHITASHVANFLETSPEIQEIVSRRQAEETSRLDKIVEKVRKCFSNPEEREAFYEIFKRTQDNTYKICMRETYALVTLETVLKELLAHTASNRLMAKESLQSAEEICVLLERASSLEEVGEIMDLGKSVNSCTDTFKHLLIAYIRFHEVDPMRAFLTKRYTDNDRPLYLSLYPDIPNLGLSISYVLFECVEKMKEKYPAFKEINLKELLENIFEEDLNDFVKPLHICASFNILLKTQEDIAERLRALQELASLPTCKPEVKEYLMRGIEKFKNEEHPLSSLQAFIEHSTAKLESSSSSSSSALDKNTPPIISEDAILFQRIEQIVLNRIKIGIDIDQNDADGALLVLLNHAKKVDKTYLILFKDGLRMLKHNSLKEYQIAIFLELIRIFEANKDKIKANLEDFDIDDARAVAVIRNAPLKVLTNYTLYRIMHDSKGISVNPANAINRYALFELLTFLIREFVKYDPKPLCFANATISMITKLMTKKLDCEDAEKYYSSETRNTMQDIAVLFVKINKDKEKGKVIQHILTFFENPDKGISKEQIERLSVSLRLLDRSRKVKVQEWLAKVNAIISATG